MTISTKFPNILTAVIIFTLNAPVTRSEAATETIISCRTERYAVEVKRDTSRNRYIYAAYDLSASSSQPSLILKNGRARDGHIATRYTFKNGRYSYTVAQEFEGRGGEIFLSINRSGRQIYNQQCY